MQDEEGKSQEASENIEVKTGYQKHDNGDVDVAVLGSRGFTRQEGSKVIWAMNGTEKESTEVEPILPIITERIWEKYSSGKGDRIDHVRVSPAVTMHLVFEGVLSEEHFLGATEEGNHVTFTGVTFATPEGHREISLVAEYNMWQNRDDGADIAIMDANGEDLL